MGRTVVWVGLSLLCAMLLALVALLSYGGARSTMTSAQRGVPAAAVPIGVMGDSDSASYDEKPGPYFASRLQWTEVLAQMRPDQVDLGEWGSWGVPRWMSMTRVRDGLGLRWRGPRRTEFRHDLAWASSCYSLMEGGWRQAERLSDIMDEEPERWKQGIVIVRVGTNDFGKTPPLLQLRDDPTAPAVRALMDRCVAYIRDAMALIHRKHPEVRFVLVGIFDNVHWPPYFSDFATPAGLRNVSQGLDYYDNALRALAAADARIAFFDDRAWFAAHWGGRDAHDGRPAYSTVKIGRLAVTNTEGDRPDNALLATGHAGLAWNALWAQSLVDLIRKSFNAPIKPITDSEILSFVEARVP